MTLDAGSTGTFHVSLDKVEQFEETARVPAASAVLGVAGVMQW